MRLYTSEMPSLIDRAQPGTLPYPSALPYHKEARMLRPLHILSAVVIAMTLQASLFGHAGAQSASTSSKDCVDATKKPATDDAKGPDSGSKNRGVTGWSGGDRQPSGGNKAEPNDGGQPATVKGLEPTTDK